LSPKLQRDARRDTLLLITADHGHITTYSNPSYEMRHHPELLSHFVILPTGENRLPYLFVKPGREDAVRALCRKDMARSVLSVLFKKCDRIRIVRAGENFIRRFTNDLAI
jgi:hypothetical protein